MICGFAAAQQRTVDSSVPLSDTGTFVVEVEEDGLERFPNANTYEICQGQAIRIGGRGIDVVRGWDGDQHAWHESRH
ncbi:MAG: hypothetical protein HOO04_00905 [Phycisphaerae bacterium]|nr:hypothetical protein [Phycisphaerae bacterium]MBT5381910.1 hypothetical protein [Phycisphaerae bacterium]MBT5582648.1 hypothetical protein [Phycisphaerae bacterium]MBT5657500.1 hypothetical protein [Phycisphaerae bacterium]